MLITGASTGIGAAVAQGLGRCGATVGIHDHESLEAAERVAAEVRVAGDEAPVLQGDVTDQAQDRQQQIASSTVNSGPAALRRSPDAKAAVRAAT